MRSGGRMVRGCGRRDGLAVHASDKRRSPLQLALYRLAHEIGLALLILQDDEHALESPGRETCDPARLEGRTMTNVKMGPLAPLIYCVHQRIAVQIAAAVNADQPDWRNRLAAVIARHLDAAAGRAGLARQ